METITLTSTTSESKRSLERISILVVDDDTTCLSIIAAILKRFKYEVVTVKHPKDAIYTLRIKGDAFDLVVSDVHMPDMNGFELQKVVAQEFNLPVVLMSSDEKEGAALKGLENGAVYFIMKPISPDDVRDLWQFAARKKKNQVVTETESLPGEKINSTGKDNSNGTAIVSASSVNEESMSTKKKSPRKEASDEQKLERSQSHSQKKPKVIWSNSLHNRFLEAIRNIGLDRAVPKKILEVMDMPGLTRENVASHLQKYRIFLRRVAEASYRLQHADNGLCNSLRSSLELSGKCCSTTRFGKFPYRNHGKFPGAVNHVLNQEASSGFGQSRLLSNKESMYTLLRPNIPNPNLMNDRSYVTPVQNNYESATSKYLSLEDFSNANTSCDNVASHKNIGTSSYISSTGYSNNFAFKSNYVGYSLSNIKQLTEKFINLKSHRGTTNLPSDGFQLNTASQNANVDHLAQNHSMSGGCGEQLSDVVADYEMLISGMDNGGEVNESDLSPIFDLGQYDIQQTFLEGDFGTSLADQVMNFQNQAQQIGGDQTITSTNLQNGGMSPWVNHNVPYFDQPPNYQQYLSQGLANSQEIGSSPQLINEPALSPPNEHQVGGGLTNSLEIFASNQFGKTYMSSFERDEDDFIQSLLAPFDEKDATLEGI